MSKRKLVEHLINDIYCRVGVSKIQGIGVIAIKNIPPGIDPFKNLSKEKQKIIELHERDLKNINPNTKKLLKDFFGAGNDRYDVMYSGPNYLNISFYLNHSETPNVDIVDLKDEEYLGFQTNRNIREGEELTIDYRIYDD